MGTLASWKEGDNENVRANNEIENGMENKTALIHVEILPALRGDRDVDANNNIHNNPAAAWEVRLGELYEIWLRSALVIDPKRRWRREENSAAWSNAGLLLS